MSFTIGEFKRFLSGEKVESVEDDLAVLSPEARQVKIAEIKLQLKQSGILK